MIGVELPCAVCRRGETTVGILNSPRGGFASKLQHLLLADDFTPASGDNRIRTAEDFCEPHETPFDGYIFELHRPPNSCVIISGFIRWVVLAVTTYQRWCGCTQAT
jgi:hypothetical protein